MSSVIIASLEFHLQKQVTASIPTLPKTLHYNIVLSRSSNKEHKE